MPRAAAPARRRERRAAGSFGLMTDVRDPHDCYETPREAVRMLIDNMWPDRTFTLWDPSCGRGKIIKAALEYRQPNGLHSCTHLWGSDKYRDGEPVSDLVGSFLYRSEKQAFENYGSMPVDSIKNIVMNPPYKVSDEHVRRAIALIPPGGFVCTLLRFTWITALKRRDLLPHLKRIIICGRLKMLPPDVEDKGHSGTVDFAWFVFAKNPEPVSMPAIYRAASTS